VVDQTILESVRSRYDLPDRFLLTLTKCGHGGDRRKNFGGILKAYARYHDKVAAPHKLVVGGKDCHVLRREYGIPGYGYGKDIMFPGWIEQKDLPAVYTMASLYLHPSNLEAFPQPVVEAMACGTPLITSNLNGLKEIAGDAALLVDPGDADRMAEAVDKVLSDLHLQKTLSTRGLARSKYFTWDKCARETLAILEQVR
jgi:glycosyltransferase involved in cell wall biosynthesis